MCLVFVMAVCNRVACRMTTSFHQFTSYLQITRHYYCISFTNFHYTWPPSSLCSLLSSSLQVIQCLCLDLVFTRIMMQGRLVWKPSKLATGRATPRRFLHFLTKKRHVDSAQVYRNEEAVGKAVHESGLNREDVFISARGLPALLWAF